MNLEKNFIKFFIIIILTSLLLWTIMVISKPKCLKVTSEEVKEIITTNSNYVIIDVRTKEDYNESRIPNSISIPKEELDKKMLEEVKDKDTFIIIYSSEDDESYEAGKELINMGYKNVYSLGSLKNWEYNIEE